ncbi:MAG: flagellar basal body rod protein FlgC [Betaproteobacteria bacterium]|nr:flagellar basal body rod protein FlgC [Betaproteobacteria bacterium]NBT05231.1 flagellar basal body rod protein FlgC [Betaproteobacteria bacterium]NCY07547.1 flagellar basal body rod protein FlgC [Betaproteobacteria bacterium]NDE53035.1 flagellar basal body rod protein FlgC [Actinomycetota bacterium]NDG82747.1 flagellar basal body rod protein FlgC [Betaproteobacteria bacterium]
MSLMRSFQVASTALSSQSLRLNALASNLANAESVSGPDGKPYKPRQVVFRPAPILGEVAAGVEVASVTEDQRPGPLVYKPGHPSADANGYLRMPNVNPVEVMVDMISASRSYQMNIEVMNTSKQLMLKMLDLGRS